MRKRKNDIFDNTTTTYLKVDEFCEWDLVSFNGSFYEFLFFDCIHPTTRAHELVAAEIADNIDVDDINEVDDDDDDNCFIASSSATPNRRPVAMISGIFFVIGFAGLMLKKK